MRDSSIELYRLLLAFLVIIIHLLTFRNIINISDIACSSNLSLHVVLLRIVSSSAVNGFILISGYFGIKFKWKGLWNLYEQAVFYGFIGALLMLILYNGPFRHLLSAFLPITRGTWWFLSSYCLVYLISPILNYSFEKVKQNEIKYIIGGLLIATSFCSIFGARDRFGGSFLLLLTLYMLGRYLSIYKIEMKRAALYWGILLTILVATFYILVVCNYNAWLDVLLCYNSIFIITQAILMFYVFKNFRLKYNKLINKCAKFAFPMYLIGGFHLINHIIYDDDFILFKWGGDFFGIILTSLTIFILSIFCEELYLSIRKGITWIIDIRKGV